MCTCFLLCCDPLLLFDFEDMHPFCVALTVSIFSLSNLFRYSSFGTCHPWMSDLRTKMIFSPVVQWCIWIPAADICPLPLYLLRRINDRQPPLFMTFSEMCYFLWAATELLWCEKSVLVPLLKTSDHFLGNWRSLEYNPLVNKSFFQFILVCVSSQEVMMMKTEESSYTTEDNWPLPAVVDF